MINKNIHTQIIVHHPESHTDLLPKPLRVRKRERNNLSEIECMRYVQSTGTNSKGIPVQYRKRSLIRTKKKALQLARPLAEYRSGNDTLPACFLFRQKSFSQEPMFPAMLYFLRFHMYLISNRQNIFNSLYIAI